MNGTKVWYSNGHNHREDGPVIEIHGTKVWSMKDGRLHVENESVCRSSKPAVNKVKPRTILSKITDFIKDIWFDLVYNGINIK